ncbi:unnamed protein product [Amoebophrya sp. A120]|nr:unnamed protein product [Amoebophrya sp. A120]|eukprot:GSA120T00010860001.1
MSSPSSSSRGPMNIKATEPRWPSLVSTVVNIARAANQQDLGDYVAFPSGFVPALDPVRTGLRKRHGLDVVLPKTRPTGTLPKVLFVYSSSVVLGTRELYQHLAAHLSWHAVCSVALFDVDGEAVESGNSAEFKLSKLRFVWETAKPDYVIADSFGATLCLLLLSEVCEEERKEAAKVLSPSSPRSPDGVQERAVERGQQKFSPSPRMSTKHQRRRNNEEPPADDLAEALDGSLRLNLDRAGEGSVGMKGQANSPPAGTRPAGAPTRSAARKKFSLLGGLLLLSPWVDLQDQKLPSWDSNQCSYDYLDPTVMRRVALDFAAEHAEYCTVKSQHEKLQAMEKILNRQEAAATSSHGIITTIEAGSTPRSKNLAGGATTSGGARTTSSSKLGAKAESSAGSNNTTSNMNDQKAAFGAAALVSGDSATVAAARLSRYKVAFRAVSDSSSSEEDSPPAKRRTSSVQDSVLSSESAASTQDNEEDQKNTLKMRKGQESFAMMLGLKPKEKQKSAWKEIVAPEISEEEILRRASPSSFAGDFANHFSPEVCPRIHIVFGGREKLRDQIRVFAKNLQVAHFKAEQSGKPAVNVRVEEFADLAHSFLPLFSAFEPRRHYGDIHMALNSVLRFLCTPVGNSGGACATSTALQHKNYGMMMKTVPLRAPSSIMLRRESDAVPHHGSSTQSAAGAAAFGNKAAIGTTSISKSTSDQHLPNRSGTLVQHQSSNRPEDDRAPPPAPKPPFTPSELDVRDFGEANLCPLRLHVIQDFSPPEPSDALYCENCLRDKPGWSAFGSTGTSSTHDHLAPCTNLGGNSCGGLRLCGKCRESHVCDAWISLLRDMCVVGRATPGDCLVLHAPSAEYPIEKLFLISQGGRPAENTSTTTGDNNKTKMLLTAQALQDAVAKTTLRYGPPQENYSNSGSTSTAAVVDPNSSWGAIADWWSTAEQAEEARKERERRAERRYSELLVFLATLLEKVEQKLGRTSADIAEDFPFATIENLEIEHLGFQHLLRFLRQLEVLAHTTYAPILTMHTGLMSLHRRGVDFLQRRQQGPTIQDRTLLTMDSAVNLLPIYCATTSPAQQNNTTPSSRSGSNEPWSPASYYNSGLDTNTTTRRNNNSNNYPFVDDNFGSNLRYPFSGPLSGRGGRDIYSEDDDEDQFSSSTPGGNANRRFQHRPRASTLDSEESNWRSYNSEQ